MDKYQALEKIKDLWNSVDVDLGQKIIEISEAFYAVGLDLSTAAAFVKATPSELDALLSLGALDEELIELISKAEPPKTTWALIANASYEEARQALNALLNSKDSHSNNGTSHSEFVYQQMMEIAGLTKEQMVGMLTGVDLAHALKKGQDFNALSEWENKFFKSVVTQKKRGKTLSGKQIDIVLKILENLSSKGAIKRNSIDGDEEICDRILDAIGK